MDRRDSKEDALGEFKFDIEHALSMYATGFSTIPAEGIYEKELLAPLMSVIEKCHIYLIGFVPSIDFVEADQKENKLLLYFKILGDNHTIEFDLPEETHLVKGDKGFWLSDKQGKRSWPSEVEMQNKLCHESDIVNFDIQYIGQAYGQDGSRNAIDRLLKHETLQKISLKGVPEGYTLTLLLLEIQANNQIFTTFAQNQEESSVRIKSGLDKLFGTNEKERITLYEASLIRYFEPHFNKEFKNSFPSTNLKLLQECYDKDFAAVVAEICIDNLPFKLFSKTIEPKYYHMAQHNLHKEDDRNFFFGL